MGYTGGGAIDIPWGLNIDGNGNVWAANNWNSLEAAARPESGSSHVDLGRRVGLHRDLWSGNAREAIGNVQTY